MPTLVPKAERITIQGSDWSNDGVFIRFSDGTMVLFKSQFLYDVRDNDANISITAESEDD